MRSWPLRLQPLKALANARRNTSVSTWLGLRMYRPDGQVDWFIACIPVLGDLYREEAFPPFEHLCWQRFVSVLGKSGSPLRGGRMP